MIGTVLFLIFRAAASTTFSVESPSVADLEIRSVGDCFVIDASGDLDDLRSVSCNRAHNVQVFAEIPLDERRSTSADSFCTTTFMGVVSIDDVLPADIGIARIDRSISSSDSLCAVVSPTGGLNGPLLD